MFLLVISITCRDNEVNGEELSKITGVSQTQFWGCCGQERLGAIYLQITENGEQYINCKEAVHLIDGISAEVLLADRGYDTNDILAYAVSAGMETVIPPKKNRRSLSAEPLILSEEVRACNSRRPAHWRTNFFSFTAAIPSNFIPDQWTKTHSSI